MGVATIVVAAGSGSRFGGEKQFSLIGGRPLVDHAVARALEISNAVSVAVPHGSDYAYPDPRVTVVAGGASRSASVRAAFAALMGEFETVLIHDEARPLTPVSVFERVVAAIARGNHVVVPVLPVNDTLKRVDKGVVIGTVDRDGLVRAQTPQGFSREALVAVVQSGLEGTDDAVLAERIGYKVTSVAGDERALKVTTDADLSLLRMPAVGLGIDFHRFGDPGSFRLAGVEIEGWEVVAHSDGDVLAHAVADAVLGAAGIGGIGDVFLDSDPRWSGADSLALLERSVEMAREKGFAVRKIDATVVLERPKIARYLEEMAANLVTATGGEATVKAKRTEGLGDIGAGSGLSAFALVVMGGG